MADKRAILSAMIGNPLYLILAGTDREDAVLDGIENVEDFGSEEAYVERVDNLFDEGDKGARVTVRLPARVVAYLGALAASNDRSLAAEILVALEVHESLGRLAAVIDQELQQERKRASKGVHGVTGETARRFARQRREDIAMAWEGSFGIARRLYGRGFMDFMLEDADPVRTAP